MSGRDIHCQEASRPKCGHSGEHNFWANVHIAENPPVFLVVDVDAAMEAVASMAFMAPSLQAVAFTVPCGVAMAVAVVVAAAMEGKYLVAPLSGRIFY